MQFLTTRSRLPPYMAFPRFLIEQQSLNETEKLIYMLLLDRARISSKNSGWTDECGHVFVYFTIEALAKEIGKSMSTVKTALSALEQEGLLVRKRQGIGLPNRIYVKIPNEQYDSIDRKSTVRGMENCPSNGQKTDHQSDSKLSPNNKTERNKHSMNPMRKRYGSFGNVYLSEMELLTLEREVLRVSEYIERLSSYMKSTGKEYRDHAATIRSWAQRDGSIKRSYDCGEEESL